MTGSPPILNRESRERLQRLQSGKSVAGTQLANIESWNDLKQSRVCGSRALGSQLFEVVEEFGIDQIHRWIENSKATAESAGIILSTVHQAKGRQFDSVSILDDFHKELVRPTILEKYPSRVATDKILRLVYVGITRAQTGIYIPPHVTKRFGIHAEYESSQVQQRESSCEEQSREKAPISIVAHKDETRGASCDWNQIGVASGIHRFAEESKSVQADANNTRRNSSWVDSALMSSAIFILLLILDYKGYVPPF